MLWLLIALMVLTRCCVCSFFHDLDDLWEVPDGNPSYAVRKDIFGTKLDLHGNSSSILNPNNIYEWTPITNDLSAGDRDTFVFDVNTGSSGFGIASTYEILILLSGNICKQPSNVDGTTLGVFYSFNETLFNDLSVGKFQSFKNGYLQALAISPLENNNTNSTSKYSKLYVVVTPINKLTSQPLPSSSESNGDERWEYKMSISENDLVYQWDSRSWLEVLDTDYSSALLLTGNVSADAENHYNYSIYDPSLYDLYVYSNQESIQLEKMTNISLCAMIQGNHLASSAQSLPKNARPLERTELAVSRSITNTGGSVREQFYITGLNASTDYVAYLTKKIGKKGNLSPDGGVLFSKQPFRTKSSNNCSLVFGLDFCSGVAYSVPSSSTSNNKTLLAQTFDHYAHSLFQNFSKALQIIPCEMELDARYSPVRTCLDCSNSYRDWLCAVTIPRCTSDRQEYYIYRKKDDNRNQFINEEIKPMGDYYEVPPCIEMCYHMVRDCPSDFGFACPDKSRQKDLFHRSYNYFDASNMEETCNYIGNATDLLLTAKNS